MPSQTGEIVLDGQSLTYDQVVSYIENPQLQVTLSAEAVDRVNHFRSAVDRWLVEEKKVIYGVTGLV